MSKTLENLLLDRIVEYYDEDSLSPALSHEYIKRMFVSQEFDPYKGVPVSDVYDTETDPEDFYHEIEHFMHSEDDELTITYEDGTSVTIDKQVAKLLVSYISVEEFERCGEYADELENAIRKVSDVVDMENDE